MEQGGRMRSKKDTSNLQVYQGPLPTRTEPCSPYSNKRGNPSKLCKEEAEDFPNYVLNPNSQA